MRSGGYSFASADQIAQHYPQYASQIAAGAKESFLDGADWAYLAGIVAIPLGAALVLFCLPRRDEEVRLLAHYHDEERRRALPPSVRRGRRRPTRWSATALLVGVGIECVDGGGEGVSEFRCVHQGQQVGG